MSVFVTVCVVLYYNTCIYMQIYCNTCRYTTIHIGYYNCMYSIYANKYNLT